MAGIVTVVRSLAAIVFVSVSLGGGFGEAAASASVNNDGTLDVQLQVDVIADTAVAHIIDPGGSQETVSLVRRSDGTFGGVVTTARANRIVVFEALEGTESRVARPVTFVDLGVAPSLIGIDDGPSLLGSESEPGTVLFGFDRSQSTWIAVALMALALALLAWWSAGPRARPDSEQPTEVTD